MPFELQNVPSTFQLPIDASLPAVEWQFALVYIDNIVVFSRSIAEQIDHVKHVLPLLRHAGVILKLKKCKFLTETIDYMGHVTCPRRLKNASHTTDAIERLKGRRNITELKSFLNLFNAFRRLVPNLARFASPRYDKYKKISRFHLNWMGKSWKRWIFFKKCWSCRRFWRYRTLKNEWQWTWMLATFK